MHMIGHLPGHCIHCNASGTGLTNHNKDIKGILKQAHSQILDLLRPSRDLCICLEKQEGQGVIRLQ